ncbi:MAG: alpha/beta hydrolase family protein [Acidimicrobiales bacterium]
MSVAARFPSGELELAGHLALPPGTGLRRSSVVLCHGFPTAGAAAAYGAFPDLADRVASTLGWVAFSFCYRGVGESEGDFSLGGWLADIAAAVAHVRARPDVAEVWLAGFGTGGGLCLCAAAADPAVSGAAVLGAHADFDDWAGHPRRLLDHARRMGIIRDPWYPRSFDAWARELAEIHPVRCADRLRSRPLLVVHGSEDDAVPVFDARVLGDAHAHADLRVIHGADHRLRDDPRAIAVLVGWLDRNGAAAG